VPRVGKLVWGLAAGGVALFALCLLLLGLLLRTGGSGGNAACPTSCAPPPKSPPLSAPHTYTSQSRGWSVDYYDPEQALAGSFSVTHEDADSITWTLVGKKWPGNWPITFQGEQAGGRSAQQMVADLQAAKFPDATPVYAIPGAELGYTDGFGEVYDINFSQATGTSQRARLVLMVAVRGDLAVELVSVGAYVPNVPSTFPHSNPAATNIVLFFSPLANSVRWPGEAPF